MKICFLKIGRYLLPTLGVIWGVWGFVYFEKTLVSWWIPVLFSTIVSLLVYPFVAGRWQWLTTSAGRIPDFLCHLFIVGTFAYFVFLSLNYYCADSTSTRIEDVVILQKEQAERHQYRRVGRNRMVSAGVHYAYYWKVVFPDGCVKTIPVTLARYNRTRVSSRVQVNLQDGFWGIPVIK